MTTPEGKVKEKISKILKHFGVYYLMPVQWGYGAAGVDYHCAVKWRIYGGISLAFFIEAKDKDKEPTERQDQFLKDRREQQNAKTFVIYDDFTLAELDKWLVMTTGKGSYYEHTSDNSTRKRRVPLSK